MKNSLLAVPVLVAVFICGLPKAHAQQILQPPQCLEISKYRSTGGPPATLTVTNGSNRTLTLSWLDATGAEQAARYALGFTFLHETGHALFHLFGVPITGREEDVADQLAAFVLAGNPEAEQLALAGAEWFSRTFAANPDRLNLVWDEHSLDPQRFVNLNCWMLGSNPARYAWMVQPNVVPEQRAVRCPGEWAQLQRSLSILFGPHFR